MIEKLILDPGPLFQRVQELYKHGLPPGDPPGWSSLRSLYSVALGQLTVVTGIPGSGKSEWLDALMVNLAEADDWHFAIYSPENFPAELHVSKIIEKHGRAPFRKGPTQRMDKATAMDIAHWALEKFIFLEPEYRDYRALIEAAVRFRTAGAKFGIVLDPWNALEHQRPSGLSETEYISAALSFVSNWCRAANVHVWIVVHPAKIYKDVSGTRPVPTPYDIAGSAHWYNKADNIITVHRDQTKGSDIVEIHVQKIRFKHIGKVGAVKLRYDRVTGRYADIASADMAMADLGDQPHDVHESL